MVEKNTNPAIRKRKLKTRELLFVSLRAIDSIDAPASMAVELATLVIRAC